MQQGLVSVIVPIYNAEKYLDQCIASITGQNYRNLEILLVDDGSNDKSYEIAKHWADKDKRIRLLRKENGGVSSARNYGLKNITGDFISFVDSDDTIDNDMIQCMINGFDKEIDIVCCGIKRVREDNVVLTERNISQDKMFSPKEAMSSVLNDTAIYMTVYNKLFRAELFLEKNNEILFPVGNLMEEADILPRIFLKCRVVKQIKSAKYNYYVRSMSLTTKPLSKDVYYIYDTVKRYEHELNGMFGDLNDSIKIYKYRSYMYLYRTAVLQKREIDINIYNDIKNYFYSCMRKALFSNLLTGREKLLYIDTFFHFHKLRKIWTGKNN